jgi:hypothetical protein
MSTRTERFERKYTLAYLVANLLASMTACCEGCRFQESNVDEATRQGEALIDANLAIIHHK